MGMVFQEKWCGQKTDDGRLNRTRSFASALKVCGMWNHVFAIPRFGDIAITLCKWYSNNSLQVVS